MNTMNEKPKSIWSKPWQGPKKILAWFGLLAAAVFLAVFCIGMLSVHRLRPTRGVFCRGDSFWPLAVLLAEFLPLSLRRGVSHHIDCAGLCG